MPLPPVVKISATHIAVRAPTMYLPRDTPQKLLAEGSELRRRVAGELPVTIDEIALIRRGCEGLVRRPMVCDECADIETVLPANDTAPTFLLHVAASTTCVDAATREVTAGLCLQYGVGIVRKHRDDLDDSRLCAPVRAVRVWQHAVGASEDERLADTLK